jgi:hypothetical protein
VDSVRRHVKQALGRPDPKRYAGQHELPSSMQRVRGAALFAHSCYRVPDYAGKIVFFHAALRDPRHCTLSSPGAAAAAALRCTMCPATT